MVGGWVLVYVRTHTQITWVLDSDDVSLGVGQTPGEPEESRSTKAQYTCILSPVYVYKVHFSYICWVAGFDDLGYLSFFF